ncbi:MAG: FAD-dependent thymidylate synthase [Spirochaetaceae bacterium]|jgi:thymidylate synthase (FAD)|nr:FAD-dependent thymidylate synthase [Spirochaetaceae bacterium]
MAHCIVPEAEAILDRAFPVLDKGFIRLVDYLGGDLRVVQAARVSYGAGTKGYRNDQGLIDYLLRNQHTSPFEQVVLTFHVKLPVFVARQWVRHRTARLNELSGRYSVMAQEFYVPSIEDVALQSPDQKQGRAVEALDRDHAQHLVAAMVAAQEFAYKEYAELIDQGISRELARINLPLSLYTEIYWQMDLHNLFHFLKLRLSPHAQKEIRAYGAVLLDITKRVAPRSCEAFERYMLEGVSFSREELAELRRRLGIPSPSAQEEILEEKALARFEAKLTAHP